MDEVYRGYRIAVSGNDIGISCRITHVRGRVAPFTARAGVDEGAAACAARARELVDRYIEFLAVPGLGGGEEP